ncbi:MAG TPA: hypothetical protein VHC18_14225 [Amycolatopsis sp.]|jgi:hypothetical protein|nr:hypothetical protein [Amycolatopsis sp.]
MALNIPPRFICAGLAHRVDKRTSEPNPGSTDPARDYAVVTVLTDGGGFAEVIYGNDKLQAVPEQGTRLCIAVDVRARKRQNEERGTSWAELSTFFEDNVEPARPSLASVN